MTLQFIHDKKGNTTGVIIPIEEWLSLKTKYTELQKEESDDTILEEKNYITKSMINQAEKEINEYKKNPDTGMDMGEFIKELEKEDEEL